MCFFVIPARFLAGIHVFRRKNLGPGQKIAGATASRQYSTIRYGTYEAAYLGLLLEDAGDVRVGEQVEVPVTLGIGWAVDALGAQPHLGGGLLAGDV